MCQSNRHIPFLEITKGLTLHRNVISKQTRSNHRLVECVRLVHSIKRDRTVEELSTQHFLETKSNELPFMNGRRVEMSKGTVTVRPGLNVELHMCRIVE